MAGIVTLTLEDDEELFQVAAVLAAISAKLEIGEEVPQLAGLLLLASIKVAEVMAGAYERAHGVEFSAN